MKLLLTRRNTEDINNIIVGVDTETNEFRKFRFDLANISEPKEITGCSSMVYSGNFLVLALNTEKNDHLLVLNIFEKSFFYYPCKNSKNITALISVYPERIYAASNLTNSMNVIDLNFSIMYVLDDTIHYSLLNHRIYGLCQWNNRWYASRFGNEDQLDGCIYEFSNDRIVYSALDKPTELFFNYNQRICFIESGKGLFHVGSDIFYTGGIPISIVEDRTKGGYWILIERDVNKSELVFIDYNGFISNTVDFSGVYSKMVEAQGIFAQKF